MVLNGEHLDLNADPGTCVNAGLTGHIMHLMLVTSLAIRTGVISCHWASVFISDVAPKAHYKQALEFSTILFMSKNR